MAILKVLRCGHCQRPLKEGQTQCSCGSVNTLVQADVNPLKMTNEMAQQYIDVFKQKAQENPKDTNAMFAMGLFYMGLKNYELAQRNFKMAVDRQPTEPDMYYYYALSLFEGKSPKALDHQTANKIEEWLHTATNLQGKRKYLILLMILRQGAFMANGLQVRGEQPDELFAKIKTLMPEPDELLEIETHVNISDPQNVEYLQILKGKKQENKTREHDYSYFESFRCDIPTEHDNDLPEDWHAAVKRLEDPQERLNFFDYMYEPVPPQKIEKPSYPIGNMLKRLIIMVAVTFVFFITEGIVSYSLKEVKLYPNQTVKEQYQELYGKKKLSRQERKEKMEMLRNDSIEQAQKDSAFIAECCLVGYQTEDKEGNKQHKWALSIADEDKDIVTEKYGITHDYRALLTLLFLLSPFIIFLTKTIVRFSRVSKQRQAVSAENDANQAKYKDALDIHHNRATLLDMVDFCRQFLSHSTEITTLGDPVGQTLKACGVYNEKEVPGRILFLNYFTQYDKNDDSRAYTNDPYHVLDRVYYVVAIPQADRLIINYNYWDTFKNELEPCDMDSVYYRNINSISMRNNSIFIEMNGTNKEIFLGPYGKNLLEYQHEDKSESLTYSEVRTGNPHEFIAALNQLISAFHKG